MLKEFDVGQSYILTKRVLKREKCNEGREKGAEGREKGVEGEKEAEGEGERSFGKGERYFLNPESVSSHLFCSICQDVFKEPYRAPCGHSFCKLCITSWLRNSKTCPEDRKTLQFGQMHHDFIVENIIGDQMVACPFRKSGCDFIGQLQLLASHKKSCDFNPNNLPEFLKSKEDSVSDMQAAEDEVLPSPAKPSLMMRLFRSGDSQKTLLKAMFDDKENTPKS